MLEIKLPDEVKYIIKTLENCGYEAYAVGGCVRDCLMGKSPKDWDICTGATPEQTIKSFADKRIIKTGLAHGTVTLMLENNAYEITTFRKDGIYKDNRHPETVDFITDIKSDLARRDFTINAMAYSPNKGIVDHFGGINDIEKKEISCVGEAEKRFDEDALRIMRALRFSSTLDFKIHPKTSIAIIRKKNLLKNIATERITTELNKLLIGINAEKVLLEYSEILEIIIPEISEMIGFEQHNPNHDMDVWKHTVKSISGAPQDIISRITMLFHDMAKPVCFTFSNGKGHFYGHPKKSAEMAETILRRLKYDNYTIQTVTTLVLYHDTEIICEEKQIKRWLNRLGEENFRRLIDIKKADATAHAKISRQTSLEKLEKVIDLTDKIIETKECFSLKELKINGNDLQALGIPAGAEIGKMLTALLDVVIDEEIENDRTALLKKAQELKQEKEIEKYEETDYERLFRCTN